VDRAFIEGVLTLNKKLVIVIDTEKLFKDLNLEIDLD
jgi:purine-binding chemotaxis protein CheW